MTGENFFEAVETVNIGWKAASQSNSTNMAALHVPAYNRLSYTVS
jgi:hypothetical protein